MLFLKQRTRESTMSKTNFFKSVVKVQIFIFFSTSAQVFAAPILDINSASREFKTESEYSGANKDKRLLIKIRLLSGVSNPGVHYIPDTTSLLDMISLAGGLTDKAESDKIVIYRNMGNASETLKYDLDNILRDSRGSPPALMDNDTILIPERTNWKTDLLQNLTIITSMLGIVVSSIALTTALKK